MQAHPVASPDTLPNTLGSRGGLGKVDAELLYVLREVAEASGGHGARRGWTDEDG
jgi:hypothetical protein